MESLRHLAIHDPMQIIVPVAIFGVVFLAAWLVRRVVLRAIRAWHARTQNRSGLILYNALRGPLMIWSLMLAAHFAVQLSDLPPRVGTVVASILLGLWILSLTLMSVRVVGEIVRYSGGQTPGALPVTTLTTTLAQIAVLVLGLLILLNHFNVSITPILTALGVGGLAVALALQDTLSNLFGGFYVAVAGQVRLGDYIRLNTGEEGYVTDIGWRCTTIRALANNLVIVPNAKLSQAIVTNFYLPVKQVGVSFGVTIPYDTDLEGAENGIREVLSGAVGELPGLAAEPAPSVLFDPGPGESGIGLTIAYQAQEFVNQFAVRNELRRRIYLKLRDLDVAAAFPSRTVYLRGKGRGRATSGQLQSDQGTTAIEGNRDESQAR